MKVMLQILSKVANRRRILRNLKFKRAVPQKAPIKLPKGLHPLKTPKTATLHRSSWLLCDLVLPLNILQKEPIKCSIHPSEPQIVSINIPQIFHLVTKVFDTFARAHIRG